MGPYSRSFVLGIPKVMSFSRMPLSLALNTVATVMESVLNVG